MGVVRSVRSSRDYGRIYARGRRIRRDGIMVVAAGSRPHCPSRLGLSVGGNVGGAVVRNRVKRVIREAFRAYQPEPGYDVVVRAEAGTATAGMAEIRRHLSEALEALGIAGEAS